MMGESPCILKLMRMYNSIESASRVKRLRLKDKHIAMVKMITLSLNIIHLTSIRLFDGKLSRK